MIEVNLTKKISTYMGVIELKVDTIFPSECITRITAPSGAGKTTLLKMLAGLVKPDHGTIKVEGMVWFDSVSGYSMKIQERKAGLVFQDYALFPNMTVDQHLQYGTDDRDYIERLLDIGEMEAFSKNLPRQLSGGQQQRLAILRAMSTRPDLLLMDEPFSALDEELKTRLFSRLKVLFKEHGTTVLLVSHGQGECEDLIYRLG